MLAINPTPTLALEDFDLVLTFIVTLEAADRVKGLWADVMARARRLLVKTWSNANFYLELGL